MIRISTKNEPRRTTITIDGQLAGEDVDTVAKCCAEATATGKPARLFLREVSNIDTRGLSLLSHLAAKGFELSASGVYSSYIVEEVRRHAESDTGPQRQKTGQTRSGT
jgi:ABC-type transporter Mla MlaB component